MSIRWQNVVLLTCVLGAVVVAALAVPAVRHHRENLRREAAQRPDPRPASDADWLAILGSLTRSRHFTTQLEFLRSDPARIDPTRTPRHASVVDTTVILCEYDDTIADPPPCPAQASGKWDSRHALFNGSIPAKLRRELVLANLAAVPVPAAVGTILKPITREQFEVASMDGDRVAGEGDRSAIQISRPVLSQDGRYAAIYVEYPECCLMGGGFFYLLERRESGWKLSLPN